MEDDEQLAFVVATALRRDGFEIDVLSDGAEAIHATAVGDFGIVILDVNLPSPDGLALCRLLRSRGDETPILMLTGRAAVDDRVKGLQAGADDYLAKPFDIAELRARVQALLRRSGNGAAGNGSILAAAGLVLDRRTRRVTRGRHPIELTAKEFDLLEVLMQEAGRVCERELLLSRAWDHTYKGSTKVVDVYVGYLRRKIDEPYGTSSIETVRGVGYRLRREPAFAERLEPTPARWRALVEAMPDITGLVDTEGVIRYVGGRTRVLGYAPDDLVGRSRFELVHPDDLRHSRERWRRVVASPSGARTTHEFRCRAADGTWRWIQHEATNFLADPDVGAVVVSVRDASEHRQRQAELEQTPDRSHDLLRHLSEERDDLARSVQVALDVGGIGLWELEVATRKMRWTEHPRLRRWADETGHERPAHATIDDWLALVHPDDREIITSAFEGHLGLSFSFQFRLGIPPEEIRYVAVRGVGEPDADGRVARWSGIVRDVTDNVRTAQALEQHRRELRRSERAAAVGTLAAWVAHDLGNVLTAIGANSQLLEELHPGLEPNQQIQVAMARARNLCDQLFAYAGFDCPLCVTEEPGQVLRRVAQLMMESADAASSVDVACDDDLPSVALPVDDLEMILSNLVANARDAMPGSGRVEVSVQRAVVGAQEVAGVCLPAGPYLLIRVRDRGIGMDDRTMRQATEPLFTTKPAGRGAGMGLTVVEAIATRAGGRLLLESEPGLGTTATVYVPSAEPSD